MHKFLKNSIFFTLVIFVIAQMLFQNCAQMASPPGGKKDTLAPKIISSTPLNKSKNFKGKKIELIFNEYISLKNINQELLITPNVGFYETKIRPNGVSIILDSALKENTTYTFNFRNAIEDVSERNPGKNIKLVFSTSDLIDSLSIKGNIRHLKTNKKLENIMVGLYPYNDTLRIDKEKPYYFTKTDTSGNYQLENLAKGKYYLAAFEDVNNNLLLNSNKEQVDFITDKYIELSTNVEQNFLVSLQNLDPLKQVKTSTTAKTALYEYNRGIKKISVVSKNNSTVPIYQIESDRNLRFFVENIDRKDTLFLKSVITDSLDRTYPFDLKIKFREINKKEKVQINPLKFDVKPTSGKAISPTDSIVFTFDKPIKFYDLSKIQLIKTENEAWIIPDTYYQWNEYKNRLTLPNFYLPAYEKFDLKIDKGAFINVESDTSAVYNQKMVRQDLENYGTIEGTIGKSTNGLNYIVEVINTSTNERAYSQITKQNFNFKYVEPGTYTLRAIEDKNQNGDWDIGNYLSREKPENIYFLDTKIKIKANFQITDLLINTTK
jgi:uncharacterized protein (DUF2141 family)